MALSPRLRMSSGGKAPPFYGEKDEMEDAGSGLDRKTGKNLSENTGPGARSAGPGWVGLVCAGLEFRRR